MTKACGGFNAGKFVEKLAVIFDRGYLPSMNLTATSNLTSERIAAEVAEMRKAGAEIASSPERQIEFLRRIGVLAASDAHTHSEEQPIASSDR